MLALFLYVIGSLFAACGLFNWYVDGYSKQSIYFIIGGMSPFILRGLAILSQSSPAKRLSFWKKFFRWIILNPLVWIVVFIAASSIPNDGLLRISVYSMLITPFVQLIWLICSLCMRRKRTIEKRETSDLGDKKTIEEVTSRGASEYVNSLCESPGADSTAGMINPISASISRFDLEKKYIALRRKYKELEESYFRLIAEGAFDSEAEAEIARLTEENNRLAASLSATQNALFLLQQQYDDLKKEHLK